MIILDYSKKNHKTLVHACAEALRAGKVVAYPTDTCYGLAADAENQKAVNRLYRIKQRQNSKPVHVIVPSLAYARNITVWKRQAEKLAACFLPGPLTLVLKLKTKKLQFQSLSARTGFLGIRYPDNKIALDLAGSLKRPMTATSANPSAEKSGGHDSYSAADIINQFKNKKYKPDIIINAGKLPKKRPSTLVKIDGKNFEILRPGPVSAHKIVEILENF